MVHHNIKLAALNSVLENGGTDFLGGSNIFFFQHCSEGNIYIQLLDATKVSHFLTIKLENGLRTSFPKSISLIDQEFVHNVGCDIELFVKKRLSSG